MAISTIPELLVELERHMRSRAADPAFEVLELGFAPPAPAEWIARHRGEWPDDVLEVWARHNGIRYAWRSRQDRDRYGGFHLPALGEDTDFEYGFVDGWYLRLDEDSGFAGCYASASGGAPFEMVFVERGNESQSAWPVCATFAEYLQLGLAHEFLYQWPIGATPRR